jgi:hypothetical protein
LSPRRVACCLRRVRHAKSIDVGEGVLRRLRAVDQH